MSALSGILYAPDPLSRDRWVALDAPLDARQARRLGQAARETDIDQRRQGTGPRALTLATEDGQRTGRQQTRDGEAAARVVAPPHSLLLPLASGPQMLTLGAAGSEAGETPFAARAAQLGSEAYRKAGAEPSLRPEPAQLFNLSV